MGKIAAVLIAKNEEECIGRCLAAVEPFVDEIVVLDTGSKDGTPVIALEHTKEVFASRQFDRDSDPEDFHFANARNEAKALASDDVEWILSIDCDEICVGDPMAFRQYVQNLNGVDGQQVVLFTPEFSTRCPRLFRREHNWTMRCHEVPDCEIGGDERYRMPAEALSISHRPTKTIDMSHERNLKLLLRQNEQTGHIGWTCFLLGECYLALERHFEAIGFLEAYATSGKITSHIMGARCHQMLATCWYHVGHLDNAKNSALRAIGTAPHLSQGYIVMAAIMERARRFAGARYYLEQARALAKPDPINIVENEAYDPVFYDRRLREVDDAERAAQQKIGDQ